jgi:predicted aspartyl protease
VLGVAEAAGGSPNRYEAFRRGAYLPYLNAPAPDGDMTRVPRLRISFGARSYDVVMDTGSTGVVVSADKIPNIDRLPSLGPGELTYSSSGRVMIGQWVVTPMTIAGANGARVTTAPIPVLAVTRIECTPQARRCTPNDAPRGVSMLGVGFARRGDHQAQSGPDRNPFLNVARLDGDGPNPAPLRRGYIVTRRGVHVGLTAANTEGDFAYVKLARAADDRDWAATPVCISVNGATPAACGTVLVDTGVTTMYLTVPESQATDAILVQNGRRSTLVDGTTLAISIPTADAPQANYAFTVGDRLNPLAPENLILVSRTRAPFVNTSLRFLNGFDYLFDADGGFAGFRWTGRAAQGVGKVVPTPPTN